MLAAVATIKFLDTMISQCLKANIVSKHDINKLQELYCPHSQDLHHNRVVNPSHPGHPMFQLLPSARHFRTANTKSDRHRNSFLPPSRHTEQLIQPRGSDTALGLHLHITISCLFDREALCDLCLRNVRYE